MKLEKFNKNKKMKNTLLTLGIASAILGGGIVVYRSYALYEEEKTYNVLKGTIPDFNYDVKVAVTIDGTDSKTIPETPYDKTNKDNYYNVNVNCGENAKGEWDYNAWNLKINEISDTAKCKLTFTSNITKADYQKYIDAGIALRRNTYRGKDITEYLKDGSLFDMIEKGTFDDIYVGDYIVSPTSKSTGKKDVYGKDVVWLVADIDNYMGSGDNDHRLTQHHLTIIPAVSLMDAKMNDSDTTAGGYYGSEMVKETLTEVYNQYIAPDFEDHNTPSKTHVITYWNALVNEVDSTKINRYGDITEESNNKGASSSFGWYERKLDLMSEMNVYGGTVWSSSGFDTGIDNRQYAIFQLKPEYIYSYGSSVFAYWLKDVVNFKMFAFVSSYRFPTDFNVDKDKAGVRPRFLIG